PVETSIPAATPTASPKSASSGKRRNRKACFVCKSVDHLIIDCDYHAKKMAQPTPRNYAHRGNYKQYASLTHTHPQKPMVPTAVLTESKPVFNTSVRPVSTAMPKINVTRPRYSHPIVTKSKSPIRRYITCSPSPKTSNSSPRVTVVQALVDNLPPPNSSLLIQTPTLFLSSYTSIPVPRLAHVAKSWCCPATSGLFKDVPWQLTHGGDERSQTRRCVTIPSKLRKDFQDNPDDEEDTKSSHEYMNDLEMEFHERTLLAYKQGFCSKAYECNEEEVSFDDNDMVKVKVLMVLANDKGCVVGKESARNSEWVKISIRKKRILGVDQLNEDPSSSGQTDLVFVKSSTDDTNVERPWLSKVKRFNLPNHDTGRILPFESQVKVTDSLVNVTDSSVTNYDLADESLVCSTLLPLLEKLASDEP
nr:hypothetical protein [Tanacetum cinerariifolium]